jgi:hypothetical protein
VVNGLALTGKFLYGIVGRAQRQQPAHTVFAVTILLRVLHSCAVHCTSVQYLSFLSSYNRAFSQSSPKYRIVPLR